MTAIASTFAGCGPHSPHIFLDLKSFIRTARTQGKHLGGGMPNVFVRLIGRQRLRRALRHLPVVGEWLVQRLPGLVVRAGSAQGAPIAGSTQRTSIAGCTPKASGAPSGHEAGTVSIADERLNAAHPAMIRQRSVRQTVPGSSSAHNAAFYNAAFSLKSFQENSMSIQAVPLEKSYRLLNHGPTVLISAQHEGVANVMAVAWSCALDFSPAKLTVVIDKGAYTRSLIERSGWFAVQVPVAAQAELVLAMGESRKKNPRKLEDNGVQLFEQEGFPVPLVEGCAGWLACRVIEEPHNQQTYDLFIGEVMGAWADDRVFRNGHWEFDDAPESLHTLHYVAGRQFYRIGKGLKVPG